MDKRDFVYHFTNIFLSEAVKETVFIENWDGKKDYDPRYEEYSKFFLEMRKRYDSNMYSDDELIETLTEAKDKAVSRFNDALTSRFINELVKRGCTEAGAIQLLPKDIFLPNSINIGAITIFRKLEEELDSKTRRN